MNTPHFTPDPEPTTTDNPHRRYYCGCCEPHFSAPLAGLTQVKCEWCEQHCGPLCTRVNNNSIPRVWTSTLNGSRVMVAEGHTIETIPDWWISDVRGKSAIKDPTQFRAIPLVDYKGRPVGTAHVPVDTHPSHVVYRGRVYLHLLYPGVDLGVPKDKADTEEFRCVVGTMVLDEDGYGREWVRGW